MKWVLTSVLSIHVLAAVFWAAFVIAQTAALGTPSLFRSQMAAAAIPVVTGVYLWQGQHEGSFELTEKRAHAIDHAAAPSRIAVAYRSSAFLLALAVGGIAFPPSSKPSRDHVRRSGGLELTKATRAVVELMAASRIAMPRRIPT
jgi:hypothetical protein